MFHLTSSDAEYRRKLYQLTGEPVNLIVVDTMCIDARRRSIFPTLHGRYRTIGFSDPRAIPTRSCRSTRRTPARLTPMR
jgi:hypothetical protein